MRSHTVPAVPAGRMRPFLPFLLFCSLYFVKNST
jgi:hypothetical protein